MTSEISKIQELIWLAETNFWIFKRIYDKYYKNAKSHNNPDLLLLIANNSFEHAILILHSLLVSKDEKELKIILEDPSGNSAILSDKAEVQKL